MSELRTSHELFNKIADVIDFQPEKYKQSVWGEGGTKFVGDDIIMWDPVNQDYDDINVEPIDLLEETRIDDACGTSACVAGWASLLSGYHPTIEIIEIGSAEDSHKENYGRYFPSMFHKFGKKISSMFKDRISYNYNIMCTVPNVETPYLQDTGRKLTMDDLDYDGLKVDGLTFHRPDYLGQELLCLDDYEAAQLFEAEHIWEGDDLRSIGKGKCIEELLDEKYNWCHACDNSSEDCGCDE